MNKIKVAKKHELVRIELYLGDQYVLSYYRNLLYSIQKVVYFARRSMFLIKSIKVKNINLIFILMKIQI
jgi:hypothetical protein